MRTYETVFVLRPNLSADEQTKNLEFYKDNITKNGGEIVNVELWGKQTLAYPIENLNEGIYILIQFKAETSYTNEELEKRFKFNEEILRYVVVMIDEKKFKLNPKKEPVRKERPSGDRVYRPRKNDEDSTDEDSDNDGSQDEFEMIDEDERV